MHSSRSSSVDQLTDSSHDFAMSGGAPSRRSELLGPRPAPLKVRKDPCKIKKPPVAPPRRQQQQQQRPPIIIYTLSPKVVHTTPGDFMLVVQRLTGCAAVVSSPAPAASDAPVPPSRVDAGTGEVFPPAARLAAFEKAAPPAAQRASSSTRSEEDLLGCDGELAMATKTTATVDLRPQTGLFGGILSPGPSCLSWISPSLFTPPSVNLFNELSPLHGGGRSFPEMNSFMPIASPSNNILSSGIAPSPAAGYWDLFNQYCDS